MNNKNHKMNKSTLEFNVIDKRTDVEYKIDIPTQVVVSPIINYLFQHQKIDRGLIEYQFTKTGELEFIIKK